ncbi:MAG: hypothetical protein DCC49_13075 [Acidobacteria bacterium]|nr:MAG: hypothetical protein DCC49_13075 [Acidobacteriota bacterium]
MVKPTLFNLDLLDGDDPFEIDDQYCRPIGCYLTSKYLADRWKNVCRPGCNESEPRLSFLGSSISPAWLSD